MLCRVCHSTHKPSEMKEGICPHVYASTAHFRDRQAYDCPICMGAGKFNKYNVTRHETVGTREREAGVVINERRSNLRLTTCFRCEGEGKIMKYKFCCPQGCISCNYQTIKENKNWHTIRSQEQMRPLLNEEEDNCTICFTAIPVGDKLYRMNCPHKFHRVCVMKWLMSNKCCPLCRQEQQYFSRGRAKRELPAEEREQAEEEHDDNWWGEDGFEVEFVAEHLFITDNN
jgi:hypothetical protein